jgi:hypothetical protein
MSQSILEKVFTNSILATARGNLEKHGTLLSVLFLNTGAPELGLIALDLPNTAEKRQAYFTRLGLRFLILGQRLREAIMLSETWFVSAQEAPAAFKFPPSQHPSRQEAIVLVGRNAKQTRTTFVVQPFQRDAANQPVWSKIPMAVYNEPVEEGSEAVGLLDDLFKGNQRR